MVSQKRKVLVRKTTIARYVLNDVSSHQSVAPNKILKVDVLRGTKGTFLPRSLTPLQWDKNCKGVDIHGDESSRRYIRNRI